MTWRLITEDGVDAAHGLAADEVLVQSVAGGTAVPTLRLYTYRPHCALAGRFQDVRNEIDLDYCDAHDIQVNRRILLPELLRRAFPGMLALYIGLYKLTVLASVIGVRELLYAVRRINSMTPAPLEVCTFLALFFLVTVIPISIAARRLEGSPWIAMYPKSSR